MSQVSVVAKLTFQMNAIDRIKPELFKLVAATRAEEGCIEYRLHQDLDDPAVFIFYEKWESMASLDRHLNSEHFKSYVAAIGDLIADRMLHKLTEIR